MRQSELDDYQFSGVDEPWKDEHVLRELYCKEGMTYSEIADVLGSSKSTVARHVKRVGIEPRTSSDYTKLISIGGVDVLKKLYLEEEMSQQEIADKYGVHRHTVGMWIRDNGLALSHDKAGKKSGIRRRCKYPQYRTGQKGYEKWNATVDFYEKIHVGVHRLVAVAEFGFDAVCNMEVHHKNHIPWDNRPENLELMTPSDHMKYHMDVRNGKMSPPWASDEESD